MENIPTTKPSKKTSTKATLKSESSPSKATTKKSTLRKLSDKEKEDIKKHISKNNLDMSAARKLRFAQMRSAEGATLKSTVKKMTPSATETK